MSLFRMLSALAAFSSAYASLFRGSLGAIASAAPLRPAAGAVGTGEARGVTSQW